MCSSTNCEVVDCNYSIDYHCKWLLIVVLTSQMCPKVSKIWFDTWHTYIRSKFDTWDVPNTILGNERSKVVPLGQIQWSRRSNPNIRYPSFYRARKDDSNTQKITKIGVHFEKASPFLWNVVSSTSRYTFINYFLRTIISILNSFYSLSHTVLSHYVSISNDSRTYKSIRS